MSGRRMVRASVSTWGLLAAVAAVALAAIPAVAVAELPFANLVSFHRVEADPQKTYLLQEDYGPWMIMACSFSGDGAERQAEELVLELRKRYKFEAYLHRMHFDFGKDAPGRGIDRYGAPLPTRYRKGNERDEVAVLVGHYPSVNDPAAQKDLKKLKYCRPECLEADQSRPTNQTLARWRIFTRYTDEQREEMGPMWKAFVTTNPKLPKDYFTRRGLDSFVVKMNEKVKHSLLKCPGKYTVQVATFKGEDVIDQGEVQAIASGAKPMTKKLEKAAEDAHKLTEALRMKGWEAYEFHDRYASIVTVGSFDSTGTPRRDGRTEINPRMYKVIQTFAAEPADTPVPAGALPAKVKSLVGIPFDIQPIPVEVPRRSIGQEMAGGLF